MYTFEHIYIYRYIWIWLICTHMMLYFPVCVSDEDIWSTHFSFFFYYFSLSMHIRGGYFVYISNIDLLPIWSMCWPRSRTLYGNIYGVTVPQWAKRIVYKTTNRYGLMKPMQVASYDQEFGTAWTIKYAHGFVAHWFVWHNSWGRILVVFMTRMVLRMKSPATRLFVIFFRKTMENLALRISGGRGGGRVFTKMLSYQYRDSHVKDKTVSRPSYL